MIVFRRISLARVAVGVVGDGYVKLYGIRLHEDFSGNQRKTVISTSTTIRHGNCECISFNGSGFQLIVICAPQCGRIDVSRTEYYISHPDGKRVR